MDATILILGQPDTSDGVKQACARLGLHPVFLVPEGPSRPHPGADTVYLNDWDAAGILSIVRSYRPAGIFPAEETFWRQTASVAKTLNLAYVEPAQSARLIVTCAEAFRARGVPVADVRYCDSRHATEAAVAAMGGAAWIQAASPAFEPFTMRVDHAADAVLGWGQAASREACEAVLVKPLIPGPSYFVLGFKEHYDFRPVDVLSETRADGAYPVVEEMTLPAGLPGADHARLVALADAAGYGLPLGNGPVGLRFVVGPDGPVLVDARFLPRPPAVICELFRIAYGMDILGDAMAVAAGMPPHSTSCRETAACVRWLPPHSGVVGEIAGVEEAAALRGVRHLRINAVPGNTLGHVTDAASRDAVGYAITQGPTVDLARTFAAEACAAVDVKASNVSEP